MTIAPMFRTDNGNPAPMFGRDGKPLLCDTGEGCCDSRCTISVFPTVLSNIPFVVKWQAVGPFQWHNTRWTFDDGQTSTESRPEITFAETVCHEGCVQVTRINPTAECVGCEVACPLIGCLEVYTNVDSTTSFSVNITGFGSHILCSECGNVTNGTKIFNVQNSWRWSSGFDLCETAQGGSSVVLDPCLGDDIRLRLQASRIDHDDDGQPPPSQVGSVSAIYQVVRPPPPIWPASLILPRVSFDHDADNGPCTLDSPVSITLNLLSGLSQPLSHIGGTISSALEVITLHGGGEWPAWDGVTPLTLEFNSPKDGNFHPVESRHSNTILIIKTALDEDVSNVPFTLLFGPPPVYLLEDDFEGTPPEGWSDAWGVSSGVSTHDTTSAGGTPFHGRAATSHAYRQWWDDPSGGPPELVYNFNPADTVEGNVIEIQYFLKYHQNFERNNTFHKAIIFRNEPGQLEIYINSYTPTNTSVDGEMFIFTQFVGPDTDPSGTYYANINGDPNDNNHTYRMPRGEWNHFRWQIKLSSEAAGNKRNGFLYCWVNGIKRWEHDNLNTHRSGQIVKFNLNRTINTRPGFPVFFGPNQQRYWDLWKIRTFTP